MPYAKVSSLSFNTDQPTVRKTYSSKRLGRSSCTLATATNLLQTERSICQPVKFSVCKGKVRARIRQCLCGTAEPMRRQHWENKGSADYVVLPEPTAAAISREKVYADVLVSWALNIRLRSRRRSEI